MNLDCAEDRTDLTFMTSFEAQLCLATFIVCVGEGNALALLLDEVLLRCRQKCLAFCKTQAQWIGCEVSIDGCQLDAFGLAAVGNPMCLNDNFYGSPHQVL